MIPFFPPTEPPNLVFSPEEKNDFQNKFRLLFFSPIYFNLLYFSHILYKQNDNLPVNSFIHSFIKGSIDLFVGVFVF